MGYLGTLEWIFGWCYFVAWSMSFWPQVILIFRRKTTGGLSTDFMAINMVGFISYTIFTYASYSVAAVGVAYEEKTGYPPQVHLSDVLFATHGAVMCLVLVGQLFVYPPRIAPKAYVTVVVVLVQMVVFVGLFLASVGWLNWYSFLSAAGMVKVMSTLIKHFPQVWLNRVRGSTVGWSFSMLLMDVAGGTFSIMQQGVRSYMIGSMAPFTSNMAKTFLATESLMFDFYFITQHLVWYTDRTDIDRGRKQEEGRVPLARAESENDE